MSADPPALRPEARERVERLLELLAADPTAPSSVTDRARARDVHVADSLSGLVFTELAAATLIADIGSGAGFPGLVLAAALPAAEVELIESIRRKCEFMQRALRSAGIENARVVCKRAETWAAAGGRERYDAATSRAMGRLSTVAELASPMLLTGGVLVVWKGRRDPAEEAEVAAAAEGLAMRPEEIRAVGPFSGSRHRHLHLLRKVGPTPPGLPRRPGMAKKRPFGRPSGGDGGGV